MSSGSKKKPHASSGGRASFAKTAPGRLLHDANMRMSAGLMLKQRCEGHKLTKETANVTRHKAEPCRTRGFNSDD